MTERINITVPPELLAAIDEAAAAEHLTRSGFLRAAALDRLGAGIGVWLDRIGPSDRVCEDAVAYAPPGRIAFGATTHPSRTWPPSADDAAALLQAFFAARDDVEVAYLFGSVARGETHPGSDIDVAVLLGEGAAQVQEWDAHAELLSRISSVFGTDDVDVVVLNSASPALKVEIVQEGIVVAGADRPRRARYETEVLAQAEDVKAQAKARYAALRQSILGGRSPDE